MESEPNIDSEIQKLFSADQADREDPELEQSDELTARDGRRLERIKQLLEQNRVTNPDDMYAAAMILHHSGTLEDIQKAHELAKEAMNRGSTKAKWLAAATVDRYLMMSGKPYQKYGTQYKKDPESGKFKLYPVDPSVTDQERARFGILSIAEIPSEWAV